MMHFPSIEEGETSAAKVLRNNDLVGEILLRLDCPTCFLRAAITDKHWLHNASNQATICNFRSKQSPHLIGIYICSDGFSQPEFVPLPDASCPELAAALAHGNFGFPDMDPFVSTIWDCRNDRVLYGSDESFDIAPDLAVRMPLKHSGEDTTMLLPHPSPHYPHAMLLPDDDNDESSCYRVDIGNMDQIVYVSVFVLRAGSWNIHYTVVVDLARSPKRILKTTLLMCGKIYMMTMAGYILTLDLATRRFSIIDLPEGVEFDYSGNLAPCRGDDSTLYLFHVKGEKLTVWLKRMTDHGDDGSNTGGWVLRDTISLPETCGHLIEQGGEPTDGQEKNVLVAGVGENAEFVFLEFEVTGIIVYMHLKTRKVQKVYQRAPCNDLGIHVLPFMMVWPVVFPKLAGDEDKELHQEYSTL
jgi:hypothetical protein